MADLSQFKVYDDTLQLVNASMKSHAHFTKEFKYTLGDQIVTKALELMDLIGSGLRELMRLKESVWSEVFDFDEVNWLKVSIKDGYKKSDYYKYLAKRRKLEIFKPLNLKEA